MAKSSDGSCRKTSLSESVTLQLEAHPVKQLNSSYKVVSPAKSPPLPQATSSHLSTTSPHRHVGHASAQQAIFYPLSSKELRSAFPSQRNIPMDLVSHFEAPFSLPPLPPPNPTNAAFYTLSPPGSDKTQANSFTPSVATKHPQFNEDCQIRQLSHPTASSSSFSTFMALPVSPTDGISSAETIHTPNLHHTLAGGLAARISNEQPSIPPSYINKAVPEPSATKKNARLVPDLNQVGERDNAAEPSVLLGLDIRPIGRLSDEATKALREGFTELDRVMKKIRAATGLSLKQIIRRWQPQSPRHLNLWNIYQKYFQTRTQEELRRLSKKDRPRGNTEVTTNTVRSAYQAFRKEEPNYEAILSLFWRIHEIDGSNTSLNERHRDFIQHVNSMKRLAESASTIHGFETAFCAVGSVVQQDQSLSATFCSEKVPDFFLNRLHFSDDEVEGHLKAHAYDYASRMAVSASERMIAASDADRPFDRPAALSGVTDDPKPTKKKAGSLKVLRDRMRKLIEPCNISKSRNSRLPFSELPKLLAQKGWILENWPEDIPFPCDLRKGKGIASLAASYRESLIKALGDPSYPLRVFKRYPHSIPVREPVIIGVPPLPESEYLRGRRRFLDENDTVDRNGPIRHAPSGPCTDACASSSSKKRTKSLEKDHADGVSAKKRKKA